MGEPLCALPSTFQQIEDVPPAPQVAAAYHSNIPWNPPRTSRPCLIDMASFGDAPAGDPAKGAKIFKTKCVER